MVTTNTQSVIDRAKQIYVAQLQALLEANHQGRFVAIEPVSGDYFVADTLDEAVVAARAKYPARLTHTLRIGHSAALHIGGTQC